MKIKNETFKVTWPCGYVRYFHKLKIATDCFENEFCAECDDAFDAANKLSKVKLAPDAFERAYNGDDAFEVSEKILIEGKAVKH